MRILVATDAWHPQVNGVVRTLTMMAEAAKTLGAEVEFPDAAIVPHLRDAELSGSAAGAAGPGEDRAPDRARRGPTASISRPKGRSGLLVRRYCRKHGLPFTTSFHTRFPEYISARLPVPESWIWAALRWFHRRQPGGDGGDAGAGERTARAAASAMWCCGRAASIPRCFIRATSISACRGRCFSASAASRSKKISRRFSISICPAPS